MSPLSPTVSSALERFRPLLSGSEFQQLITVLGQELLPSIRVNLLKHEPAAFMQSLQERYGWKLTSVPFCKSGFNFDYPAEGISKTSEHGMGEYYIQESASMLPVELFDFSQNSSPLILDMAASPGGKTTHLVDRTGDRGLVIANDASKGRIAALRVVLAKWGAVNHAITCLHGEYFGSQLPGTFDAVLLDAPCSMQNLYDTPSHPLRSVSAGEQQSLSNRQYLLLRSALQTVKVGGQVVYSTCTLSPEEDEQVVERVLQDFGDQVRLDDMSDRLPKLAPALQQDGEHKFSPHMVKAVRLWPHIFGTTGFFSARFTKLEEIQPSETESAFSPKRTAAGSILPPQEQQQICNWMQDFYGFDLQAILQTQLAALMELANGIFLVPTRLSSEFGALPISSFGLNAFKRIPQGYQISHELAARFGHSFRSGYVVLDEVQKNSFLMHQDILGTAYKDIETGETVLVRDEQKRVLGRAKVLRDRLKNLLPPRLF